MWLAIRNVSGTVLPNNPWIDFLAGKDVVFEIKVNRVAEPELPEIDADFISALGIDGGTEEELRSEVRDNMTRELNQKLEVKTKERVMDLLVETNAMDIPQAMIDQEAEQLKQQTLQQMQAQGQQTTMDLPASVFEGQAKRRVHLGLLVAEIIKSQSLSAGEPEIRAMVEELASSYEDPEEFVQYYLNNPQQRAGLENVVLENKVVDWVIEQVSVEDEQKTFDEVMNPPAS